MENLEDWHSQKSKYKEKDREKDRNPDRWKIHAHHTLNRPFIRHDQGRKYLKTEQQATKSRERQQLRTDLNKGKIETDRDVEQSFKMFISAEDKNPVTFKELNWDWNDKEMIFNREQWKHYHQEYKTMRERWDIVPVNFYVDRMTHMFYMGELDSTIRIADVGCGEGKIYQELSSKLTIDNYDMHAVESYIIEANTNDLSSVGVEDNSYDLVICSLSIMGSVQKKINEVSRILKRNGKLWSCHTSSCAKDLLPLFEEDFELISEDKRDKFTFFEFKRR